MSRRLLGVTLTVPAVKCSCGCVHVVPVMDHVLPEPCPRCGRSALARMPPPRPPAAQ